LRGGLTGLGINHVHQIDDQLSGCKAQLRKVELCGYGYHIMGRSS
jgi:hypothetical protein